MTKEMRALLQGLEQAKAEVRALLAEDKVAEAEAKMEEVRALQKKVDLQKEIEAMEDFDLDDGVEVTPKADKDLNAEYKRVFMRGLRGQRISRDDRSVVDEYYRTVFAEVMHEGTSTANPADGDVGMLVPQDIQTRINEIQRQLVDLSQYVRVERVNTLSGSRVLERDDAMTPLQLVEEYGQIQAMDNPQFDVVPYQLVKRAGYLPLTSELLADSDQNILEYVANWIAKKYVVTKNLLVVGMLQDSQPGQLTSFDDIKRALNVDLDPAISLNAVIITNQDGYHWMDTQIDNDGRYLLQDDITQPGRKLFKGRPVVVVSNRYLPTIQGDQGEPEMAPVFIGWGQQFAVLFSRGLYELASTREGGDAWRRDSTELRVITRDDLVQWDAGAGRYYELQISDGTPVNGQISD